MSFLPYIRCIFPQFHEALSWIFRTIPDVPNFEWIFTLPLYWLVRNHGLKNESQVNCGNDFIDRFCLPRIKDKFWDHVRQSCMAVSAVRYKFVFIEVS